MPISLASDSGSAVYWDTVSSVLPYLATATFSATIGVQNGTLYDVLDDNNGNGNVAVGAKSFNVTCGSLPNTTVIGPDPWMVTVNFSGDQGLQYQFPLNLMCRQWFYS
jgi:hypothetical protein